MLTYKQNMGLGDLILNSISSITRNLPDFRGLDTICRLFNQTILALGASPIAPAKMHDGTTIWVNLKSGTEMSAYYRGEYDADLIDAIRTLLQPDTSFLDIGANVGFYTVSIADAIREKQYANRIISFEPFEANYQRILDNLTTNQLDHLCSVHQIGLSDQSMDSLITLRGDFLNGSNTGNAAIPIEGEINTQYKTASICLETLDEIWAQYDNQKIDIIKMDIEGHEDFCLKGGQKVISSHRPTILMEVCKPYYVGRNIQLDQTFLPLIPENYAIYRKDGQTWREITSLEVCDELDNVFLVPKEKLELPAYQIFNS
jgi:FkbM family methyltransferase